MVREAAVFLANREAPLASTLPKRKGREARHSRHRGKGHGGAAPGPTGRRVLFGTVPDFSFRGQGVRVGMVVPKSPAAAAGIVKGDIIIHFAGKTVKSLRSYSKIMKGLRPGARIAVTFRRKGEKHRVETAVRAR